MFGVLVSTAVSGGGLGSRGRRGGGAGTWRGRGGWVGGGGGRRGGGGGRGGEPPALGGRRESKYWRLGALHSRMIAIRPATHSRAPNAPDRAVASPRALRLRAIRVARANSSVDMVRPRRSPRRVRRAISNQSTAPTPPRMTRVNTAVPSEELT